MPGPIKVVPSAPPVVKVGPHPPAVAKVIGGQPGPLKVVSSAEPVVKIIPPEPVVVKVIGGGTASGGGVIVWGQTPGGAIDGVNRVFTTLSPYASAMLAVYLNGLRQRPGNDYQETGSQSFTFSSAPLPGDSISIDYQP